MYMDFFIVCLDWLLITYNLLCYIVRFEFAVVAIQGWGDVSACFAKKPLFGGGYTGVWRRISMLCKEVSFWWQLYRGGRRASWMRIGIFRCDGAR